MGGEGNLIHRLLGGLVGFKLLAKSNRKQQAFDIDLCGSTVMIRRTLAEKSAFLLKRKANSG